MKLRLFILATLLLSMQYITAKDFKISGKVIDHANSDIIEYATVTLLKADSSYVNGTASDINGEFLFNKISEADYLVAISFMGYETAYVPVKGLANDAYLGNVPLSPSAIALDDITVTAQSVIQKSDRKVILPSQAQINASSDGLDLLTKLMLSRITIDKVRNTISTTGQGSVQLRINGVEVTIDDVNALRPEDILRIEYHEDPGMRYNGAGAVIDYITRRKESGGNIFLNTDNTLSDQGLHRNSFASKVNYKKSEFGLKIGSNYQRINWISEKEEQYIYPDKTYTRNEQGLSTPFKNFNMWGSANYSLLEQDKYFLNVTFRGYFYNMPSSWNNRQGIISTSDGAAPLRINDLAKERENSPTLDLYFQRNLTEKQLLIFNVVGTYIGSKSERTYTEQRNEDVTTNIFSDINGKKHSLIIEGIYENKLDIGKFTAGIKHNQSYTENKYLGNTVATVGMNYADTYGYGEFQLKQKKFTYTLGLGLTRNYYSQGEEHSDQLFFRPTLNVAYNINDNASIRYNGHMSTYAPSLSDMNDVQQEIDSLKIRQGNPNLKTTRYIFNSITGGYKLGMFNFDLYTFYRYNHKPVMDKTFIEDGKFILTKENQKGYHRIKAQIEVKAELIKDHLTVGYTQGFNRYIVKGDEFTHTQSNWYGQYNLSANYKCWNLDIFGYTYNKYMESETLYSGEAWNSISISYKQPKYTIGLSANNLFANEYKQTTRDFSTLTPSFSKRYTSNLSPLIGVKFTYNFNFGREVKSGNQRLNNSDSDSGIMK